MSLEFSCGSAAEFKQHLGDIQAMMARFPPSFAALLHTVIRSKYNHGPASVTFACIEREVTSILKDKCKSGGVVTETSREDPIASMATF